MRELVEKRTATAKHFDLGNGICRLEAHIGQIHYRDGASKDGAFQAIDTTLEYYEALRGFGVTQASYEAQIGLYGDVRFFNVDHSLEFRLPNANKIEAQPYAGSEFGRLQKALIWRDILQPGGHQIVEARNNSLVKIFRFDQRPISNIIEFQAIPSAGVKFSDGQSDFDLTKEASRSIKGRQGLFHSDGRLSWIRQPRAWNHRGEIVDVELQFFRRGNQVWLRKIIPQDFIDRTFNEARAWLECDTTTSFYAGAGDGCYQRQIASPGETFSAIRSGAQTGSNLGSAYDYDAILVATTTASQYNYLYRAVFPIDTSSMGYADVSAATFYLYGYSRNYGFAQEPSLSLDHYTAAGYPITNYDGVKQAPDILLSNFTVTNYNSYALNATGRQNINVIGTTQLATRISYDIDNAPPTWASGAQAYFQSYFSEQTGTANDPYLSVTYTPQLIGWNRNKISKPHYRM
jgi:hypothetical protein